MFLIDKVILLTGLLVLAGILSRKFSARTGLPVLVLFLLVGMLAGSEGIGRIPFENYPIAHAVGTLALVVILFDGGLSTEYRMLRISWKPAILLATVGVVITAVVTGFIATQLLGLSLLEGLLLASIVASTDAPAVFSILRSKGVHLRDRLQATLEVESGSNDPMAVILTVGMIEIMLGDRAIGPGLITFFLLQMGGGLVLGYAFGKVAVYVINRIRLDAAGLYPVLAFTFGLMTFGITVLLKGSGFLAVYVAGIVIGNSAIIFRRGTLVFHDALAWVSQIVMFILLGLLSFPSRLIEVTWQGLAVGAVLALVARPLAVFLLVSRMGFSFRELVFLSWVGLKGAVPIILAIYPLLYGLPRAHLIFNVIFFVVLMSAILQGWTLPWLARRLGLEVERAEGPPVTLDLSSIQHIDAEIVEYEITERSAVAHLRLNELDLPEDVVVAMVTRGSEIIPARGPTVLLPGDHVSVILRQREHERVDAVFRTAPEHSVPLRAGILLPGSVTLEQLSDLYGVELDGRADETMEEYIRRHTRTALYEGSFVEARGWRLYVHERDESGHCTVGVEEARD